MSNLTDKYWECMVTAELCNVGTATVTGVPQQFRILPFAVRVNTFILVVHGMYGSEPNNLVGSPLYNTSTVVPHYLFEHYYRMLLL